MIEIEKIKQILNDKNIQIIAGYLGAVCILLLLAGSIIGVGIGMYFQKIHDDELLNITANSDMHMIRNENKYYQIFPYTIDECKFNTSCFENLILNGSINPETKPVNNTEIDNFLYNGIYGWFCDDDSSYEPAISDVKQQFIDRKCHLISIENTTVNRSYYIENGWN